MQFKLTTYLALLYCISPSSGFASACEEDITDLTQIGLLISCVQELATENTRLQMEVRSLQDAEPIPGPQGPRGVQGAAGPPGENAEIPKGAILAFDRPNGCPESDGWVPFEPANGRFIVGVDGEKYTLPYLAGRPRYVTGGAETHTLTQDQMPAHNHGITHGGADRGVAYPGDGGSVGVRSSIESVETMITGGGQPHNNMPPYIALYFCILK